MIGWINRILFTKTEANMKTKEKLSEDLLELFAEANEEELIVLKQLLAGISQKKHGEKTTYLDGLYNMDIQLKDQECILEIPLSPLLNNPLNIVHGGVIATIIDTAMGTLSNSFLQEFEGAVTTQLNVHYLAQSKGDYLICKAKCDHKGAKTMVLSAEVYREDGKKVAQASGSFFIVRKQEY